MLHGYGVSWQTIDVETGTLFAVQLTHYPPLLSIVYATMMWPGVPYGLTPALLTLVGWVLLLSGIGVLTYRLSGAPVAAALAVSLSAMTHAYLTTFVQVMSEPLFLPLLVWLMVILTDLPERSGRLLYVRLGAMTLLLALLPLTRYVGLLAVASVLLWWVWLRLHQHQAPRSESRPCNTPSNSTPNRAGKGYLRPSRRRGSGIVCKHARRLSGCAPIRLLQEITNRTSWWAIIANG
jgi:hypothetical protein